ncbi:unnamed protein product [Schistosoma margrebowiei]|uniref:Uncharacterized protein n=1 Tax=Schistosoma margrebowiei TaxID=48269 RepID=A0A183N1S1_9TREM|nr:unnamed protein product [Schistosoma margrebowiei]
MTVVAAATKADDWVEVENKERHNAIKEKPPPLTKIGGEKLKTNNSDRSVLFQRIKESESSEPKTCFQPGIESRKNLAETAFR